MHYSYFNYVFLLFSEGPERLRDLSKLVLAALGCKASSQELQVCALSSTCIKPSSFCPASCRSGAKMRKGPRELGGGGGAVNYCPGLEAFIRSDLPWLVEELISISP